MSAAANRQRELAFGNMRRLQIDYEKERQCVQERATFCPAAELPNLMIRWSTLNRAIAYMSKCFAAGKLPYWKALP